MRLTAAVKCNRMQPNVVRLNKPNTESEFSFSAPSLEKTVCKCVQLSLSMGRAYFSQGLIPIFKGIFKINEGSGNNHPIDYSFFSVPFIILF